MPKMVTYSTFAIVALYLTITLLISYLVNKRFCAGRDFSTGGKQFGWFTAGVSILATYISAMTFVGMPGWVYSSGMQAMSIHLNYPVVIFFCVIFFVPVFYKLGLISIYEYLELRFGIVARTINSMVFIVVQCISAGVILYAVALILIQILPISISEAIIYISIFTAFYTYSGGISTVIFTDIFQSAVLAVGSITIFISLLNKTHIKDYFSHHHFTIINFDLNLNVDTTLWAGIVAASFLHLSVYGTNQLIIQRTLATKCIKTAQKSMLLCGYGAFFIYLFFAVLGVLLSIFYQNQPFINNNEVILDFVFNHTNPVIVGLIISSLTAAAMSTLDSTYNSMATVATFDIYKRFIKQDASSSHYESIARKMSLCAAAIIVVPALLAVSNESVLKTIASLTSIFVGIRLGSFVLGLFCAKANEKGVIAGSIASVAAVFTAMFLDIAWPWFAPIGTLIFLFFGVIVSRYWGKITAEQQVFIDNQRDLFEKPTASHYGLLVFAAVTIVICTFLPDWLYAAFS
ncbi:sodium:solute symporter family transporter [Atlantibacter hermannii]|uniref:sodium:solute symporter family transporter n=1 Tax=Atlantibacter hermannii TaxID=565 RepID=UPI00289D47C6|nr:sodium/solute symporter [Atlantibacter hermannii]